MAQFNSAEKIDSSNEPVILSTDVMTGDRDRSRYLYYQLKMSMSKAKGIDIIVSFLMESGIRMILNDIRQALDKGASVRILTGNYLGITQPSALYLLKKEFGNRIDLRFYNDKERSFHPKAYIFHNQDASEIFIGSSNISKSALTSGIEWNYRFSSIADHKNYRIFASVATLGRAEYLKKDYFPKDYFDYIVIDEFHHAVNEQYRKIVNYFTPKFMLGLTATPERMDGKNIYEICDYNVLYEISLKEAINKGMLVPFHYYGVYDDTDYSKLHLVKGRYDERELTEIYRNNGRRYELIYKHYMKCRSKRALGFCCSRQHAEEMAAEFCKRGIASVAVYSHSDGEFSEDREKAIQKLKNQEVNVIFSVDMFNEGVDIASVDLVMFLRPTESPVVFLQQLGRGLRIYKGKEYLNVLDFIGNYEKAGKTPLLLGGEKSFREKRAGDYHDIEYPDDCIVDFDVRLIDLFKELDKKSLTVRERIRQEYFRVKELLDEKVPTRMDLFTYMEHEVYQCCIRHTKENPFRHYLEYLHGLNELSGEEQALYAGIGKEFLTLIETTDMSKIYKMPILYTFYNHGNVLLEITEAQVLACWKDFFDRNKNWRDFSDTITYQEYKNMTDKQHLSKAKTMPIKFLKASGKGFFIDKEGYALAIRENLRAVVKNDAFCEHMKDILEYRTMDYYRRRYKGE